MNSATASPLTCPSLNAQTSSPRRQILQRIQLIRSYWNWKCALLSATVRSTVYLIAMARSTTQASLASSSSEVAYVALTAGIYAGLQQQALRLRSHLWGNLAVVIGVPGLSSISRLARPHPHPRAHSAPRTPHRLRLHTALRTLPSAHHAPRSLPHRTRRALSPPGFPPHPASHPRLHPLALPNHHPPHAQPRR